MVDAPTIMGHRQCSDSHGSSEGNFDPNGSQEALRLQWVTRELLRLSWVTKDATTPRGHREASTLMGHTRDASTPNGSRERCVDSNGSQKENAGQNPQGLGRNGKFCNSFPVSSQFLAIPCNSFPFLPKSFTFFPYPLQFLPGPSQMPECQQRAQCQQRAPV